VDGEPIDSYRVAAIQFEPTLGAKAENIGRLVSLTEEAAQAGARLIVHPEMATTGYCWHDRAEVRHVVEPIPGPTTERFAAIAARYDCYIVAGLPEVSPRTDIFYNSAALIGPEGLIGVYRKTHSYISEPKWAKDGDLGLPVWETPIGRIGILICADAAYFETARLLALRGADILCFPTNWLDDPSPAPPWLSRAYETGCYLIAANRYGLERGVQFCGGSCVIDPDGEVVAWRETGDGVVLGDVSLAHSRAKSFAPTGSPEKLTGRRPDLYDNLTLNTYLYNPYEFHGLYGNRPLPSGRRSRIAAVQLAPKLGDLEANLEAIERALDELGGPVDLAVFPEYALTARPADRAAARDVGLSTVHGTIEALRQTAASHGCAIAAGFVERLGDDLYSAVTLVGSDGELARYRKAHPILEERAWCTPGVSRPPVVDLPVGRIGLLCGTDLCFPEAARSLAVEGCDLLLVPAGPGLPSPRALHPGGASDGWHLARERAQENDCFLVFASLPAPDGVGRSGVFAPTTKQAKDDVVLGVDDERVVTREIDTTNLETTYPTCAVRAKESLRRRQTALYDLLQEREPAVDR
jgi:predicted amidohydrolase